MAISAEAVRKSDQVYEAERRVRIEIARLVERYASQGYTLAQSIEKARALVEDALSRVR